MSVASYLQGVALGGSLIIAIGAQNAYVLSLGIKRNHQVIAATICILCDVSLIALGVVGVGSWIEANPSVMQYTLWGGAAFLIVYGFRAIYSALRGEVLEVEEDSASGFQSCKAVIATTLAVSLLNPHVYLDTIVLIGSISGKFSGSGRYLFGAGAATASVLWFYALGLAGQVLAPLFARRVAWRLLDVAICLVMWGLAAKLVMDSF